MGSFKRFKMLPKRSKWRIVVRYTFFQIPDMAIFVLILILIHRWVNLPPWLTWGLVSLWVIKDILMFPFVWSAYERLPSGGGRSLVGTEGIAEERLAPSGYVRLHGELWQAEVMERGTPIEKGERVMVQGVNGLTLLVRPTQKMTPFFPTPKRFLVRIVMIINRLLPKAVRNGAGCYDWGILPHIPFLFIFNHSG